MRRFAILSLLLAACEQAPRIRPQDGLKRGSVDVMLGPRQNVGPSGIQLGPVGGRLWCDGLAPTPGLRGTFQYIHPGLDEALFDLEFTEGSRVIVIPPMSHRSYPSHVLMTADAAALHIEESKFIGSDDRAVDSVVLRNDSADERRIVAKLRTPLPVQPVGATLAGIDRRFGVAYGYAIAAGGFSPGREKCLVNSSYNGSRRGNPDVRASFTCAGDSPWAAVDGIRAVGKRWTCAGTSAVSDWFEVDFGEAREVERIAFDLIDDGAGVRLPRSVSVEIERDGALVPACDPLRLPIEGHNEAKFTRVPTRRVRITMEHHPGRGSGLAEFETFPERTIERILLQREIVLAPHATMSFAAVGAFGDDVEIASSRALEQSSADAQKTAAKHVEEFNTWFERSVPRFECSDPGFERLWWHRWAVVRRCLTEPKAGFLRDPCFVVSRGEPRTARILTAPHAQQCDEVRWLRDPRYARGHVSALLRNQFEGKEGFYPGMLPQVQVEQRLNLYSVSWIAAGVLGVDLIHPDREFLAWALPKLEKHVEGVIARFDVDRDGLPVVLPQAAGDAHTHSGTEGAPSFFWFSRSPDREETLETVLFACALYADCRAIAAMRRALSKSPTDMEQAAMRVAQAINEKMWDKGRRFYYGVRPDTDEKALVEEISGYFPYAFDVPSKEITFDRLFDPEQFWGAFPARSVSRRSDIAVPPGSLWNGAVQPRANALIAEALAGAVRRRPDAGVSRRAYYDFLQRWVRAQFEDGDASRPRVGESYDADTGAWLTRTTDVFDAAFADLLIRHAGGLVPRSDDLLEFWPIVDAWSHFKFEGVPYRGKLLGMEWKRGEGFYVRVNGGVVFRWPTLEHVIYDPATGKATKAE